MLSTLSVMNSSPNDHASLIVSVVAIVVAALATIPGFLSLRQQRRNRAQTILVEKWSLSNWDTALSVTFALQNLGLADANDVRIYVLGTVYETRPVLNPMTVAYGETVQIGVGLGISRTAPPIVPLPATDSTAHIRVEWRDSPHNRQTSRSFEYQFPTSWEGIVRAANT